jgi:hypothetical protein
MMEPPKPREVALPASIFSDLSEAVARTGGREAAERTLEAVGRRYGRSLASQVMAPRTDEEPRDSGSGPPTFWGRLATYLADRGWGSLSHQAAHPALGLLASPDWAEAAGWNDAATSCAFSTGMFAGLLSALADRPVAVHEAECRSRGDARCAFLFGSQPAVETLRRQLATGADLRRALEFLGS